MKLDKTEAIDKLKESLNQMGSKKENDDFLDCTEIDNDLDPSLQEKASNQREIDLVDRSNELFLKVQTKLQKLEMREEYAEKAYQLAKWAILGMFSVVGLSFFHISFHALSTMFVFKLSDKVVIALISAVTVNVIGILVIVIRNLFPSDKSLFKLKNKNKQS